MGKIPLYDWWHKWFSKRNNERFIDRDAPVPVILVNTMGSAGQTIFGDSATAGPKLAVLEDNSLSISGNIGEMRDNTGYWTNHPMFGTYSSIQSNQYHQYRLFSTTLTATAGGEITAAAIGPPALASWQCCMCITHLWSDSTDGSIAMSITSTGGLTVGPASWAWATTANSVTDYTPGVFFQATADNDTIDVSCAAGQAQANQVIHVMGYYWYET